MITEPKRSIAFLCPTCRQSVIINRTVFQLAASGHTKLPCPCGKSHIDLAMNGEQVDLTVPCLFCQREHTVCFSTQALFREKTIALSCSASGLDCCYVGEENSVFAAMRRLEETVDDMEASAGKEGTFLNDIVMEEILGELRDIAQRRGISCTCGSRKWKMKVNYSSVEISCAVCGGKLKIPAATLSDLDDLCCKSNLIIRGNNR